MVVFRDTMLWILLWLLSVFRNTGEARRNTNNRCRSRPQPVPTGSLRWIDLRESRIVRRVSTLRPSLSLWLWPGRCLTVTFGTVSVASSASASASASAEEHRGGLVEVDMSDGSVECRHSHAGIQGTRCIQGIHRGHHVILAFFRGGGGSKPPTQKGRAKTAGNGGDLSAFLNARRLSGLYFEDLVALVAAHGLLPQGHRPDALYVVLADLSEHVFEEGQIVSW